ncbi:hypothetical protein GOP47_0028583 [Adiantum capillus-veneris]|nr:hypothetical protein GOP47_0028583 [Adiantum capillus-veneris]
MALWSHRTRHRFNHEQLLLFFLLVDESQLVAPSLAPAMGDAQADVFVKDMFGAIYQYKKSYAKTDNCALLPICAGTLIPDLDRHRGFGVTSWGKLTVSLSGLGAESAIQLLEQSLDREYGGLLKSKPMLEILHHVL